jgi:DNA end-binding protein Ku
MAQQLVESMTTTWDPSEFKDTYRDGLMELIQQRAAHPEGGVAVAAESDEDPPARVLDLMTALKGSLAVRARGGRNARPGALRVSKAASAPAASTAKPPAKKSAAKKGASKSTAAEPAAKRPKARKSA